MAVTVDSPAPAVHLRYALLHVDQAGQPGVRRHIVFARLPGRGRMCVPVHPSKVHRLAPAMVGSVCCLPRARGQQWLRTAKPRGSVDSLAVRSSVRALDREGQDERDNSRGYAPATALPAAALPARRYRPPTDIPCNSRHTRWQPAEQEAIERSSMRVRQKQQKEEERAEQAQEWMQQLSAQGRPVTQKAVAESLGISSKRMKDIMKRFASDRKRDLERKRQQREDLLVKRVQVAIQELNRQGKKVTLTAISQVVGLSLTTLQRYAKVHQILLAVKERNHLSKETQSIPH